jgi:HEAT repeat protein
MNSRLFAILIALLACSSATAQEPRTFLGKDLAHWCQQLQSEDPQDRHAAAWAFSQIGQPAFQELIQALRHDDPVVRYWAVHWVAKQNVNRETKSVLPYIRKALTDPAPAVRIEAASNLAQQGRIDETLPVHIAALDDPQESAAIQAAAALAALGKRAAPARSKLQQAEKNGGEYVKRLAARALANLDQE